MKCLLLETSCVPWGVGLAEVDADKARLLGHIEDEGARTLAGNFINAMDGVLREGGIAPAALDAIAVSLGPGSWTGLRIGLTAAKTLALSFQIPLYGIPTFDVVAKAICDARQGNKLLLVQAPCRPGERYAKLWHCRGAECDLLKPEWIGTLPQISEMLTEASSAQNATGVITASPNGGVLDLPETDVAIEARKSTFVQRLQALADLAALRLGVAQQDDALALQPIYLAPSAAEREYYAKQQQ